MRKAMLLCSLLLWAAPALADPFTAGFVDANSVLVLSGPAGQERFEFGFSLDIIGSIFKNASGIVAGLGEKSGNPFLYASIYGQGGYSGEQFKGGNGAPWASPLGNFISLTWPNPSGTIPRPELFGLTDSGLATGQVVHWGGPFLDEFTVTQHSWQIGPVSQQAQAPEPAGWVLMLAGLGMAWLARGRR